MPITNPGTWVTPKDYPAAALAQRVNGTVSFEVEVDKTGKVIRCVPTESNGNALLDATACEAIEARAGFEPARDSKGRPYKGV